VLNNPFKKITLLYLQGFQNLVGIFINHNHKKRNLQDFYKLVGINLIVFFNKFDLQGFGNLTGLISITKYELILNK
jgi:hypothetical protein